MTNTHPTPAENLPHLATIHITEQQRTQAALVACDRTGNPDHARTALAALALIDPYTQLADTPDPGPDTRRRSGTAVHGTATALAWHRRTRVPLCRECRAWAARNGNGER